MPGGLRESRPSPFEKSQGQSIEPFVMLPLSPVAASAEDMQLGVLKAREKTKAYVERNEAIVPAPYHERRRDDLP